MNFKQLKTIVLPYQWSRNFPLDMTGCSRNNTFDDLTTKSNSSFNSEDKEMYSQLSNLRSIIACCVLIKIFPQISMISLCLFMVTAFRQLLKY